jgi:Mg2+-importing ATPase
VFVDLLLNPLVLILVAASLISGFLGEPLNAAIVILIVLLSVALDFVQVYRSEQAAKKLRSLIAPTTHVWRDGKLAELPVRQVVPGDLLRLEAGDLIPADATLQRSTTLSVDEAALTGESLPTEKRAGRAPENQLFAGTSVVSGVGEAVVTTTGSRTQFGTIARALIEKAPPTEFERGARRFGYIIMRTVLGLVGFVFLVNVVLHRPPLDSLLFALALAVGLTPEFLPMIITVTLAAGAQRMADAKVIVKRLAAIENLGNMDTLCSDKTGTLTLGGVDVAEAVDLAGQPAEGVLHLAAINSALESGVQSPFDAAILARRRPAPGDYHKLAELPLDFERRRLSVLVATRGSGTRGQGPGNGKGDGSRGAADAAEPRSPGVQALAGPLGAIDPAKAWTPGDRTSAAPRELSSPDPQVFLVTKGAPEGILPLCTRFETGAGVVPAADELRQQAEGRFAELSQKGYHVLAVAWKELPPQQTTLDLADEADLVLSGFVAFLDPPDPSAAAVVAELGKRGVAIKILTGDGDLVTRAICSQVGVPAEEVVHGDEVAHLSDDALAAVAERASVFARVSPAQKHRIISALKRRGHVVGYLGDGINDAPSLHAADVGISVANGVDVAKAAADVILLEKSLAAILRGVVEGRRSFGNITKYILMGTSSNFGNMLSMAAASIFLPFLPMLPVQILLNNFLYDLSQVTIPTDNVDEDYVTGPRRWDTGLIQRFMFGLGPISSLYDFLTFGVMLFLFHAGPELFRAGWFIESLATQTLVIFVIRTAHHAWQSRPSRALTASVLGGVLVGLIVVLTPLGASIGFAPLPPLFFVVLALMVVTYLGIVEWLKKPFYRV